MDSALNSFCTIYFSNAIFTSIAKDEILGKTVAIIFALLNKMLFLVYIGVEIFLIVAGRSAFCHVHGLLVPAVQLLVPAVRLLVPAVHLLVPAVRLLVPVVCLLVPVVCLLVPAVCLLVPAVCLLAPAVRLLGSRSPSAGSCNLSAGSRSPSAGSCNLSAGSQAERNVILVHFVRCCKRLTIIV